MSTLCEPRKACSKCREVKPLDQFPVRRTRSADGHRGTCYTCTDRTPSRSPEARRREREAMAQRRGQKYLPMERHRQAVKLQAIAYQQERAVREADARWVREANRERERAERKLKAKQRWNEYDRSRRSSLKVKARRILQDALRRGKLSKPSACQQCGLELPKTKLHGHHDDYSQPLAVRWLCIECHTTVHGGMFGQVPPGRRRA